MDKKTVRIGGASGFWGDSSVGAPQLVRHGKLDYLVFDYLAELTMSLLAGARRKNPDLGYATDFVTVAMRSVLADVVANNIRVISNAGGVNPRACAAALQKMADEAGIKVKIAVVEGDDVLPLLPALREEGVREMQSGKALPAEVLTANAYLGALPICQALNDGAQIVITGRCVDSAVTLGALMHAFAWSFDDYDKLAQASLAGHILECGCQATGGLFTDWQTVPDWDNMGYPIVECGADGNFIVTKPENTGGLVTTATVAEQILYEIGDPARYLLPDVVCDFTQVRLRQEGPHRVSVQGAIGLPPTNTYKVSATYLDGFRVNARMTIIGMEAGAKAKRTGEAILARVGRLLREAGQPGFTDTRIDVLGTEASFGEHASTMHVREAVLHLAATHPNKAALDLLAREVAPAGTSWAPGTTGVGGRPAVAPSIRQYAFLLDKSRLAPSVVIDGVVKPVAIPTGLASGTAQPGVSAQADPTINAALANEASDLATVELIRVAHGRSGDKGDISNIGIIARKAELLPWLRAQLTPQAVATYLAHFVQGPVTRYDLPGLDAFNLVCEQALDGGGMASLRNDPLGKGMAQILLSMPVRVPARLL